MAPRVTVPAVTQISRLMVTSVSLQKAKPTLLQRLARKVGFLDLSRSRLKGAGYIIYEQCVDNMNFMQFIEEVKMPDTLFSWFLVTELHCWLLMTRAMAEGAEGRAVRNSITEALWQDVSTRIKKLEAPNVGQTMQELSQQFQAAIIGYDEGLQSGDIVLAGALWRRMLSKDPNIKPETLEFLVNYVRRQAENLDSIPRDQILSKPEIKWLPLKPPAVNK
ncbi:hypothetical protein B566_EDAN004656 [Ephemera danica]|nr:hypothetical protein B566_EDAN004656 [Ephemera danica]